MPNHLAWIGGASARPASDTVPAAGYGSAPTIFDELDYQLACQAYLWALPIVSYAQWKTQHYEVFGATSSESKRLREILKQTPSLNCGRAVASNREEFQKWQASVINVTECRKL